MSGVKFSDYISIDQDVATCSILCIEEMYDDAKNKNNGEEAEDVHANEAETTPVQNLSDAIKAYETVRTFMNKGQKTVLNLENLLFNLKN
ncbi:hypothetical protein NPIL_353481 [Nephila pilipes]|uniref:Uncharacterized protein n=1 Tax=Nephila pilipes TaxID=299642 RepID=A0A8X6P7B3_NEPPI|nr:hypothetical protein NPIL_353481 [Nephila pilipes]